MALYISSGDDPWGVENGHFGPKNENVAKWSRSSIYASAGLRIDEKHKQNQTFFYRRTKGARAVKNPAAGVFLVRKVSLRVDRHQTDPADTQRQTHFAV